MISATEIQQVEKIFSTEILEFGNSCKEYRKEKSYKTAEVEKSKKFIDNKINSQNYWKSNVYNNYIQS